MIIPLWVEALEWYVMRFQEGTYKGLFTYLYTESRLTCQYAAPPTGLLGSEF